jgi:hypothetical protein
MSLWRPIVAGQLVHAEMTVRSYGLTSAAGAIASDTLAIAADGAGIRILRQAAGMGHSDLTHAGAGALATAARSAAAPEPSRPMGRLLLLPAVPAIIAPVPTIITPIIAPIPTASHAPHRDRGRAGHRCGPHDRSPSHHSATHTSTSTQHLRLLP